MNINDKCEYIYQTPSTDHATFLRAIDLSSVCIISDSTQYGV